jgi:DNA-binding transcriptional MerR regulator
MMTTREIDEALERWNARLAAAAQNLVDLQSLPAYERLAGMNGVPKATLTGDTAERVEPALKTVSLLLQYFDLLQHTILRAEEIRRGLPAYFGAEEKHREIEQILRTASIRLPSVAIPLGQRSLLSGVENTECIAPEQLLNSMAQAFDNVKSGVLACDAAWERLGRGIDACAEQIRGLRGQDVSLREIAELDSAQQLLEDMRERAESDPLSAFSDFDGAIAPALDRVRAAVEQRARLRQEIEAGLKAAEAALGAFAQLHRESVAAYAELQQKVSNVSGCRPPEPEAKVQSLSDWLDRLKRKHAEGLLEPITIGLRQWNNAARECVSNERGAMAANRAPLELRTELRGRLDALKAKARAYGVAENPELTRLAEEAYEFLQSRPTPMDRAQASVSDYERALTERARFANAPGT